MVCTFLSVLLIPAALQPDRCATDEIATILPAAVAAPPAVESLSQAEARSIASLFREGVTWLREGEQVRGVERMESLLASEPALSGWAATLAAEAVAPGGDTARVRRLLDAASTLPSEYRAERIRIQAMLASGDALGAEIQARLQAHRSTISNEKAEMHLWAARAAARQPGRSTISREMLRSAMRTAPSSQAALSAAYLLPEASEMEPEERLLVGRVQEAHNNLARALDHYKAAYTARSISASDRAEARLQAGALYFRTGQYSAAATTLQPLFGASGETGARALYWAGRAHYRLGSDAAGRELLMRAGREYPGTEAGADALFLQADLDQDANRLSRAEEAYRLLVASFPASPRTTLASARAGGMYFLQGEYSRAADLWERHQKGSEEKGGVAWAQAAYWAARAHQEVGDTARAKDLFRSIRAREPISYYALLASQRLGSEAVREWPVGLSASPQTTPLEEYEAARWLQTLDILREADLSSLLETEITYRLRAGKSRPGVLYAYAEGLQARHMGLQGIKAGQALLEVSTYNPRLLRILYPFPYQDVIRRQAERQSLAPSMVAALMRQESAFHSRAVSRVGARGLMQIMPGTGKGMAGALGISKWDPDVLFDPEVNVAMGTRYLAAQMRSWGANLPYVFSAYNAGPGRVQRWRNFPEAKDRELFTERIPFEETRSYVKILTRNTALYEALYGQNELASAE